MGIVRLMPLKQTILDQWGVCSTPEVWRSDNMVSNPRDEKTKKENKDSDKKIVDILINTDELDFYLDTQLRVFDYTQNWSAYNKSQTSEFTMFQDILIELLDSLIISKKFKRPGRPFLDLKEMIYCCIMRTYFGKSSRRGVSFLDYAIYKGYINKKTAFQYVIELLQGGSYD